MKLLIVEDEKNIANPLKRILERNGFMVDLCFDGMEGYKSAVQIDYDCIILDLNLPGMDGIEVAKKLRAEEINTPIIMLTARSQVYDTLDGFESGADDYVTKPFETKVLLARINALIKRNSLNQIDELEIDGMKIEVEKNKVIKDKKEIELSSKEMGVLEYLLRNKGKAISSEELLEHVWDSEINVFTETVKTHMKTLRKKIDPKKKIIKTIRGKGYLIE